MSWDDIATKIDRLRGHLDAFAVETSDFLEGDDNGVINDFDSEPGYLSVKAFSRAAPPRHYSILLGEMLYHMRSSLDYLACQLTEDHGGVVDSLVEFPIFIKPSGSAGFGALGDPKAWNFKRIGGMDLRHQKIIQDEQPFQGKYGAIEDDPLSWLYHLSNIDRHRFLHVVTAAARTSFIHVEPPAAATRFLQINTNFGPVEEETEVVRYSIADEPDVEMNVESNVKLDVAFGDAGPLAGKFVSHTMGSIGVRVFELVQMFR